MLSVKDQLLHTEKELRTTGYNKVTVVGVGQVGMACAFGILTSVRFFFLTSRSQLNLNRNKFQLLFVVDKLN